MEKMTIKRHSSSLILQTLFLLFIFLICCQNKETYTGSSSFPGSSDDGFTGTEYSDVIKVRTFQNSDSSWGYMIFLNSKLTIYQRTIPGKEKSAGFRTESDARKVAGLASKKLLNSPKPVAISHKELDSLGISR